MPFGLKNAPATFQRAIDIILSRVKWQYALVYLDDVIIYSKSFEEHIVHVRTVLTLLSKAGISLKLKKCEFFRPSVSYLGHTVRPGKLEVASKTCNAVRQAKPPQTQTELRSFLGLCNVYRRFVPNFARIAAPLNKKLMKDQPTNFETLSAEEYDAFQTLKRRLIEPPILALPKGSKPYRLETDACDHQVGCVLTQEQDDPKDYRPIGYWSRSLTKAEKNYSATERECLAIVWSVLLLRPYLEGAPFVIRTDHDSLRWLLNIADVSGRLARWRLRLSEFDFEVVHRPGVKHQAADALSRMQTNGEDASRMDDEIPCFLAEHHRDTEAIETVATVICGNETLPERVIDWPKPSKRIAMEGVMAIVEEDKNVEAISVEEFLQEQARDPYCQERMEKLGLEEEGAVFEIDQFGILCRRAKLDGAMQKVVPKTLRDRLLYLSHYPRLAGHPGQSTMYNSLRRQFFWPFMANDVYQMVKECRSCAAVRGTPFRHQKFLKLFPATGPMEFVAMDFLGPLPKSHSGKRHVLVITDRFTKLSRAIPLRDTNATTTALAFLEHWVFVYGAPTYLLTDRGANFTAKFFQAVCSSLGVKNLFTTAYHPQTNGQSERFNRTLISRLKHYVAEHQRDWDQYIYPLTYAYNMQVHKSTGTSPFNLVLTRHPPGIAVTTPSTGMDGVDASEPSPAQFKKLTLKRIARLLEKAKTSLSRAQARYKADFDKRVRVTPHFTPRDEVFLDRPPRRAANPEANLENAISRKLLPATMGPYPVIDANEDVVTIRVDGLPMTVSIDRCTRAPPPPGETAATSAEHRQNHETEPADMPPELLEEPQDGEDFLPENTTPTAPTVDLEPDATDEDTPPELIEELHEQASSGEYVIHQVVDARQAGDGTYRYRVNWFGYDSSEDTWHKKEDIPEHFVTRYWNRIRRREA